MYFLTLEVSKMHRNIIDYSFFLIEKGIANELTYEVSSLLICFWSEICNHLVTFGAAL